MVYGVSTAAGGVPVAVETDPGNTGDPATVGDQVAKLKRRFGLARMVLVGDRGRLTETSSPRSQCREPPQPNFSHEINILCHLTPGELRPKPGD
jgi:hypothetical protein